MDIITIEFMRKLFEEYNTALQNLRQDNQELREANKECWVLEWKRWPSEAPIIYGAFATKNDAISSVAELFSCEGELHLSMKDESFTITKNEERMEGTLFTMGEPIRTNF